MQFNSYLICARTGFRNLRIDRAECRDSGQLVRIENACSKNGEDAKTLKREGMPLVHSLSLDRCPHCGVDRPNMTSVYRFTNTGRNPVGGERKSKSKANSMPKYVIERDIPDAGKSTSVEDLRAGAQKSCGILQKLGTDIQWVQSYVTDDKVYCVFIARDEQLVREHAKLGGIPANRISEVRAILDPATADL
jgi:hypothetical protein